MVLLIRICALSIYSVLVTNNAPNNNGATDTVLQIDAKPLSCLAMHQIIMVLLIHRADVGSCSRLRPNNAPNHNGAIDTSWKSRK